MTAQHARPLVAYLCVALAAALLLVAQGITVPRDVPVVSGVIGGVSSLELGKDVVLTPLQPRDEVAAVGGAVPRRVAEQRSVIQAAAPRSVAPRAATRVRPRGAGAGQPGAGRSGGTHQPKPARASGAAPKANRPGRSGVMSKGHARTSPSTGHTRTNLRSAQRETRGSQRGSLRAKGHGSAKGHGRRARRL